MTDDELSAAIPDERLLLTRRGRAIIRNGAHGHREITDVLDEADRHAFVLDYIRDLRR
jgi:hypothetical protein